MNKPMHICRRAICAALMSGAGLPEATPHAVAEPKPEGDAGSLIASLAAAVDAGSKTFVIPAAVYRFGRRSFELKNLREMQIDGKYAFNRGWLPRDRKGPHMHASATRKEWFECACCPPNWARWVVQVPGFIYATRANDLFVNLYVTSETSLEIGGGRWKVKQETNYPWDGRVRLSLTSGVQHPASEIAVRLRLPGWARGEPVAGDLYRYLDNDTPQPVRLRVNGEPEPVKLENGYAVLRRAWKTGDEIELDLPMPVRRVAAHAAVKDLAGQVAVERGPIVYCVEGVDHGGRVLDLALPDDVRLDASFDAGFAGGVTVVRGQAVRGDQRVELRLIPHFAWANRGVTEMTVWMHRSNQ